MTISNLFEIEEVIDVTNSKIGNSITNLIVEGNKIEAQLLLRRNTTLLLMVDGAPFEERLNIHLIDNNKLLDTLEISPPYQSMIIEGSQAIDDQTISLTINGEQFIIQVRTKAINLLEKIKLLNQGVKIGKEGLLTFQKNRDHMTRKKDKYVKN